MTCLRPANEPRLDENFPKITATRVAIDTWTGALEVGIMDSRKDFIKR